MASPFDIIFEPLGQAVDAVADPLRQLAQLFPWSQPAAAPTAPTVPQAPAAPLPDDSLPVNWQDPETRRAYLQRVQQFESGGRVNEANFRGTRRGLFQFGPEEERNLGIDDRNREDPGTQWTAANTFTDTNIREFRQRMGRDPRNEGELYLSHQQGAAGGPALLQGGSTPAWRVLRQYYRSDAVAQEAIWGNLPGGNTPENRRLAQTISAQDFANLQMSRFSRGRTGAPTQVAPGQASAPTGGEVLQNPFSPTGVDRVRSPIAAPGPVPGSVIQAPPALAPQRGLPAGPWGPGTSLIGTPLNWLLGEPVPMAVQGRAFRQEQMQNEALATAMARVGVIRAQNEGLPPRMLLNLALQDREILRALGRAGVGNQMPQVMQKIVEALGQPPPEVLRMGPGQEGVVIDPETRQPIPGRTNIQGPPPNEVQNMRFLLDLPTDQRNQYLEVLRARARATSGADRMVSELIAGGTARAQELGIGLDRLPQGQQLEIRWRTLPDGTREIGQMEFNRPLLDLGPLAEREAVQKRVQHLETLRDRLSAQQAAVVTTARMMRRLGGQMDQFGAGSMGAVGFIARLGEGVIQQARAVAAEAGIPFDPRQYASQMAAFERLGPQSAETQSNILALAFNIARVNEPTGPLSRRDVEQALDQLGARMGSPAQARAAMGQIMEQLLDKVDDQIELSRSRFTGMNLPALESTREVLRRLGLTGPGQRTEAPPAAPAQPAATPQAPAIPEDVQRWANSMAIDQVVTELQTARQEFQDETDPTKREAARVRWHALRTRAEQLRR